MHQFFCHLKFLLKVREIKASCLVFHICTAPVSYSRGIQDILFAHSSYHILVKSTKTLFALQPSAIVNVFRILLLPVYHLLLLLKVRIFRPHYLLWQRSLESSLVKFKQYYFHQTAFALHSSAVVKVFRILHLPVLHPRSFLKVGKMQATKTCTLSVCNLVLFIIPLFVLNPPAGNEGRRGMTMMTLKVCPCLQALAILNLRASATLLVTSSFGSEDMKNCCWRRGERGGAVGTERHVQLTLLYIAKPRFTVRQ